MEIETWMAYWPTPFPPEIWVDEISPQCDSVSISLLTLTCNALYRLLRFKCRRRPSFAFYAVEHKHLSLYNWAIGYSQPLMWIIPGGDLFERTVLAAARGWNIDFMDCARHHISDKSSQLAKFLINLVTNPENAISMVQLMIPTPLYMKPARYRISVPDDIIPSILHNSRPMRDCIISTLSVLLPPADIYMGKLMLDNRYPGILNWFLDATFLYDDMDHLMDLKKHYMRWLAQCGDATNLRIFVNNVRTRVDVSDIEYLSDEQLCKLYPILPLSNYTSPAQLVNVYKCLSLADILDLAKKSDRYKRFSTRSALRAGNRELLQYSHFPIV